MQRSVPVQADVTAERNDYIPLLACLSLLMIAPLSGLAQSGLTPVLPRISDHFAEDPQAPTLVRLMVSGLSFAMILGSLGAGFVAERIGQRSLLLWSLALYAVAGTIGAFLDNLYLIVGSRLFLGVLTAVAGVMTAALITTRIAPQTRDRWLGFYVVAGTFGGVVVLGLAGQLGSADWRSVFLLHLLAIPVMLLLVGFLPRSKQAASAHAAASDSKAAGEAFPTAVTILGLVCGGVIGTPLVFLPFFLVTIGEATPERISLALMGSAFAGGVVSCGFGWIRGRLSVVQVAVMGFAIAGAGMIMVVASSHFPTVLAAMVVFGLGVGIMAPNLFSAAAAAARPERRARTIGFVRAAFFAGPLIAQIILEPAARLLGAGAPLLGTAIFAAIGLVYVLLFRRAFVPVAEQV